MWAAVNRIIQARSFGGAQNSWEATEVNSLNESNFVDYFQNIADEITRIVSNADDLTLISLEKDITKSVETHINGLSAHLYDWTVSADPQMEVLTGLFVRDLCVAIKALEPFIYTDSAGFKSLVTNNLKAVA